MSIIEIRDRLPKSDIKKKKSHIQANDKSNSRNLPNMVLRCVSRISSTVVCLLMGALVCRVTGFAPSFSPSAAPFRNQAARSQAAIRFRRDVRRDVASLQQQEAIEDLNVAPWRRNLDLAKWASEVSPLSISIHLVRSVSEKIFFVNYFARNICFPAK
jgi:hypothetical protein